MPVTHPYDISFLTSTNNPYSSVGHFNLLRTVRIQFVIFSGDFSWPLVTIGVHLQQVH